MDFEWTKGGPDMQEDTKSACRGRHAFEVDKKLTTKKTIVLVCSNNCGTTKLRERLKENKLK